MGDSYSLSVTAVATRICFPGAEELRMLRALTHTASLEACRHGEYRAAFRGFHIDAVRWYVPGGYGVTVEVRYDGDAHSRTVLVLVRQEDGHGAWIVAEHPSHAEACLWESIATARVL